MSILRSITLSAVAVCVAATVAAEAAAQQPTFSGQIRPRLESRDESDGPSDTFTSMRVRFGIDVMLEEELSIFIQGQDVRLWGSETSPLLDADADNFDIHQAYLRFRSEEFEWLTATIGRQETRLGGERLVGAVNWAQQGQTFDGVRLDLEGERGTAALLGYVISDDSAPGITLDRQLFGAYATRNEVGPGALDVFWLYDRARNGLETDEHSFGARYVFGGEIDGRVEATIQSGTRADADVSSFMFGGRVGTDLAEGRARVALWYDFLSGDDPSTAEIEVFSTLYATGHKFYGFADLFTNIPQHTGNTGLQDLAAKFWYQLTDDVTVAADLHHFRAAADEGLTSGAHFADEIDFTVERALTAELTVTGGLSFVFQDDALAEVGRLGGDQRWFYLMLDAIF